MREKHTSEPKMVVFAPRCVANGALTRNLLMMKLCPVVRMKANALNEVTAEQRPSQSSCTIDVTDLNRVVFNRKTFVKASE